MNYTELPLSQILRVRPIFEIFDNEFEKNGWLDVTALLNSDSTVMDLYQDDTVPHFVLDAIVARLEKLPNLEEILKEDY